MSIKNILLFILTGFGALLFPEYTFLTRGLMLDSWLVSAVFGIAGVALGMGALTKQVRIIRGALLASALAGWMGLTSLVIVVVFQGTYLPLGYFVTFAALIVCDLIMYRNPTLSNSH